MKISLILLFAVTMQVIADDLSAQSAKVTVTDNNISVGEVLNRIEAQTSYLFVYNKNNIDLKRRVSLNVGNESVTYVLNTIFANTDVGYTMEGNNIILSKTKRVIESIPNSTGIAQKNLIRIVGTVTDDAGDELPGVSIIEKGTVTGTISDQDGHFEIKVNEKAVLEFSYLGYKTQSVQIGKETKLEIILKEDTKIMDEVVVVAYGTQKRSSITGSIDVLSGKTIEKMPVSNIAYSLQGTVPGLVISDKGGKPGSSPSVSIRGTGTIGVTDPLVIIDGVPTGMSDFYALSSADIASISVLKDASSAAIYGSRASNGVLLVTTRMGDKERKPVVDISYSNSSQVPVKVPELNDAWDYAMLVNESYTQAGGNIQYTEEQIQMMRDGSNPDYYTNTNWWKSAVKSHDSMNQANIRVSGGSSNTTYMISAGYTSQKGLIEYTDFSKYNTRMNLSTQIIPGLEITAGASYYKDNKSQPDHYDNFFGTVLNMPPYLPIRRSNGDWGHLNNEDTNPIAWITDGGNTKNYDNNLLLNGSVTWDIIPGLKLKGQISNNLWELGSSSIYRTIKFVNEDGSFKYSNNPNSINKSMTERSQRLLQGTLEYEKRLSQNYFKVLGGLTDEHYKSHWLGANRRYIPDNEMEEIEGATGTGDDQSNWGSSDEWRMYSYFGRINYDYAGRYFAEFNIRYDGSSRLATGHQYTAFPSGSAGWRISEESFMAPIRKVVDNLKLRVSYGQLGNQSIGLYQYAAVMANNPKEYMFGHQWVPGAYLNILPNYELSWEKSTILDIGLDFSLFDNRLSGSFDWYRKKASDFLLPPLTPKTLGIRAADSNAGVMANWGEELQLTWRDKVNKFNYGVTLSFADQKNEVLDLEGLGPYRYSRSIIEEGQPLNALYGYKCLGFFSSQEEIDNSPKPTGYASQIRPGDLKYADISGPNGVPDGIIDSYDRTTLGWNAPRFMYGLDFTGEWNGFDFRVFFQGVGKRDEFIFGSIVTNPTSKTVLEDRWNPNKTVEQNMADAKLPRFVNGQQNNYESSSFYVKNAAYLRLKNLQIGYTLPKNLTQKISFERVRCYFSAVNLFTITSFPYVDPESSTINPNQNNGTSINPTYVSSGVYYPQLRSYTFGIDITIGKN